MKTHTVTEKWLAGTTFLQERDDWSPGDRSTQFESTPGYRCACGQIIRPGQKVSIIHGSLGGEKHFWAECPNCGNTAF